MIVRRTIQEEGVWPYKVRCVQALQVNDYATQKRYRSSHAVVERFNQERFTIHVWAATIENYITGPISFVYIDDIFYVYR